MINLSSLELQRKRAIAFLEKGVKLATMAQDVYLQGLSYSYLAEAYYSIEDFNNSIINIQGKYS
ncbi:MAG: hypothetical protein AB4372_22430 [Xenococcus sp. (in: cyanobacteria)]